MGKHEHGDRDRKKKKHKSKSRKNRSRSSSSSSSDDEIKLLQRLSKERKKAAEEKAKRKEMLKIMETPEEKRLRRLMKKEGKERKRKEQMGWDNEYLHYTNNDNPFGDSNLLSTFVWGKKLKKDGIDPTELERINKQKMEENKRELEKVKKRRLERELERTNREKELSLLQRNKEAAQFHEWEVQEDQFHLEQARLRSKIRIQDGRAKPIDLLAKYISAEEEMDDVEMNEPYIYLNGLSVQDLEDLLADIKVYMALERDKNSDYWDDITTIVQEELQKFKRGEGQDQRVGCRDGIHQTVVTDVISVFRGKSVEQLREMQCMIEEKINSNEVGIDIPYWESLFSKLKAFMARARLRQRHQGNLKKKLELLKAEQMKESAKEIVPDEGRVLQEGEECDKKLPIESAIKEDFDVSERYDSVKYSPKYVRVEDLDFGIVAVTLEDDENQLRFSRHQLFGSGSRKNITKEEAMLLGEARKGMTEDEAEFSVELTLGAQMYLWSDKYRPRKPRYFNRVHTGFEWNKYNQTHYDMDNPPPKIVQGYKFNIFYPDLIDKQLTPQYSVTPCQDNRDFAVLRFKAGPPYEDIAFKIVHREWEFSYKKGFRCQFQNNIFQLWFHFKRYRYRR